MSYERRFSEAFSRFNGVRYCVPTANGSSALTVALEALGIGFGDEVLVPGLTWVACASSVAGIGGIPILVDIDPDTLCMDINAARANISRRTAGVLVVHAFCTVADLDAVLDLTKKGGLSLIEDCSQAHGAKWEDRRVGSFGDIGVFSMQQTKVLTCGEGGAAITEDHRLFERMQELRADGRRYSDAEPAVGLLELEETGSIQGRNYCLSEFQSAILLDRLRYLDEENASRERGARRLSELLSQIGGITPLKRAQKVTQLTYYHFCVRISPEEFHGCEAPLVAKALSVELGLNVEPVDSPLNRNPLYDPLTSPRTPKSLSFRKRLNPRRFPLPNADIARKECLTFPHQVLLGSEDDATDIADAFEKVKKASGFLSESKV